jgi:hypothetical protein
MGPRSGFGMIHDVETNPLRKLFLKLFSIAHYKEAWVVDHT